MSNNANLTHRRLNPNDEFYTHYDDIKEELDHYLPILKQRRIYFPCDNDDSQFVQYAKDNDLDYINTSDDFRNHYDLINNNSDLVIITNPPFSLFSEFLQMIQYNSFIIVGSLLKCATPTVRVWSEIGKLYFGNRTRDMTFTLPNGSHYKPSKCRWITNIQRPLKRKPLPNLTKTYYGNESDYPTYDRFPHIINVNRIKDIPNDYDGYMGVPLTMHDYLPNDTFQLIGHNHSFTTGMGKDYYRPFYINGNLTFTRLVIQRKQPGVTYDNEWVIRKQWEIKRSRTDWEEIWQ